MTARTRMLFPQRGTDESALAVCCATGCRGVEAGYGYIASSQDLNPLSPHGLLAGLRYGYLIVDRPTTSALLSLALGYNWFPVAAGGNSLQAFVYGLAYEHVFFRKSQVALAVEYGLLFNLLLEDGRQGYAFGHHTRLGLGPMFTLGERDELVLLFDYNIHRQPSRRRRSS